MGFFFEDAPPPAPIKRGAVAKREAAKGEKGCDACPLRVTWQRIGCAQMPVSGDADADILILGDAPSLDDDRLGAPFMDADGKLLRKVLPSRWLDRIAFGNLTRCASGSTNLASHAEAHACSIHLEADLLRRPIKAIIGVGPGPLYRFFGGKMMHVNNVNGVRMPLRIGQQTVWFYPILHPAYLRPQKGWRGSPEDSAAWPVFKADLKRFFAEVDRWGKPEVAEGIAPENVFLPTSYAEAREMLDAMEGQKAVDLETNHLRPYMKTSRLLMGSVSDGIIAAAWPVDHPEEQNDWGLRLLTEVVHEGRWTAHNAAFEYMWLKFMAEKAGLAFDPAPFDCTQAAARVYFNRETVLSLEMVSQAILGVNVKALSPVEPRRILEFPLREALRYCGLDTLGTARMLPGLLRRIHSQNYQRLLDAARTVADMALLGLDVDTSASARLKAEWEARAQDAEERAISLYEVKQFKRDTGLPWSISAPEDVGRALVEYGRIELPRTAGGKQYSTDDATLTKAAGDAHPLVKATLEYRTAKKMVSTYVEPILRAAAETADGRIHPNYTTTLVATLRLSSEDPNIQNFPKRKHNELREQVVAPKGHVFGKFDYKALEARIIAMASKDRALCESTIRRVDIHKKWRDNALAIYPEYIDRLAIMTNQTELEKILKGGRDIIKTDFVFASFFGSTASAVAARTGMPLAYAQELSNDFWREFEGVKKWIKERRVEYAETGAVRLLTGHERRGVLPGNEPINTPIQGSAAQIVVDSMNELAAMSRRLREPYLHPRINIHDDLTFVLPEEPGALGDYLDVIMKVLVKVRYEWQIVPLAVEGAVGESWADMIEFCNYEGEYNR